MKKILKEPFFHFILIGFACFALYGVVNKNNRSKDEIIINDFDITNLIAGWEMQWKRSPTEKELENLINLNIKQEIFYQEALKMNLDHNDEIIKRRLAQKMQFLSDDIASMQEPTAEELQKYFLENSDKYMRPYTYSFYQLIFSPDNRSDPKKDASDVLNKNSDTTPDAWKGKGDKLPFPFYYDEANADELALQLGSKFSEGLQNLDTNKWLGPVASGFGYHLVYITKITKPQLPDFNLVKDQVIVDFEYDKQKESNNLIYKSLKKKYNIKLDIKSTDFDPKYVAYLEKEINS